MLAGANQTGKNEDLENSAIRRGTPGIVETLGKLADTVFRPDIQPGTGLLGDFPIFYSAENAGNLYYFEDKGRPVSSAGVIKGIGIIKGVEIHLASLGQVWTLSEYRGIGLAGRIIEEILKNLDAEGISLVLVSGDGGLYRKVGCVPAGKMITATHESGIETDLGSGIETTVIAPETRQDHAKRLLSIYENEPFRFFRSLDDMKIRIKTLGYQRSFLDRQLFEATRNQKVLSYAVGSVTRGHDGSSRTVKVIEWAGSRRAFLKSLNYILRYYGADKVEFNVLPSDFEMTSYLRKLQLKFIEAPLQGTLRPVNVNSLISELKPWFVKNLGGAVKIISENNQTWLAEGPFGVRRISGYQGLSNWLFNYGENSLRIPLMLTDDLNYC